MAVLGKIRSRGKLLVCIIGLGLFAFIAEEAVRSCESTKNNERQQIAEVLGQKITYQEFQDMVDEYTDVIKMTQGRDNLDEDELNQVRDMVWNNYLQNALIAQQAEELGLTVTDGEIRDILAAGTDPMLAQTPFVNQQTGRFDANMLKQFMAEYKKAQAGNPQQAEQMRPIYNFWTFLEKNLRQQRLAAKYQTLLAASFLSNPVEAKQTWQEQNEEATITLATLPYSTIAEKDIKIDDADIKAKYDQFKARFRQPVETRDIKYVAVRVAASAADRAALAKSLGEQRTTLATATDPAEAIRKAASTVPYLGVPVLKAAFPVDIAQQLDSIAVGATTALTENKSDNTLNAIRLIARAELPDSIQFAAIQVAGDTPDDAHQRADSITAALAAAPDKWDAIAKTYGQTGDTQWITTAQYQNAPSIDADTRAYITALNTLPAGQTQNITTAAGNIIVKVTDRRAMTTKYTAAVIKASIAFSKDTYSKAYNRFSQYVSENQTLADLEKNAARNGYQVIENADIAAAQHNIAGIHGTHEALKWAFESKADAISPLYECGDNDCLLVVALTKVHQKGFRPVDDPQVRDFLRAEVLKDKRAEQLIERLKGCRTIAAAKAKGATVSTINQVTFAAPVFIPATGASEPALAGAVARTKQGQTVSAPVKGNAAVYLFNVASKKRGAAKYNQATYEQQCQQRAMQAAGNYMQELYIAADITDNRVAFF